MRSILLGRQLGFVVAFLLPVVACGESVESKAVGNSGPGDGGLPQGVDAIQGCPATQPVDVSAVSGSVPACNVGYAHPSVCCLASPTQATVCTECPAAPFGACDSAALTFPDPRLCCSLDGGACRDVSVGSIAPTDAGNGACYYPCGPGGYPPDKLISSAVTIPACADGMGSPNPVCEYCCSGEGTATTCALNECNCPLELPGSPPCVCGPQCNVCPSGWQVPQGGTDLCCRTDSLGEVECFSQATSIATNPQVSP
jgi:hypothetical protein